MANHMFSKYNHLGFFNPYLLNNNEEVVLESTFPGIMARIAGRKHLNISAISGIVSHGFLFGDQTIIKEVGKVSWFTRFHENQWDAFKEIKFGFKKLQPEEIVSILLELLKTEILDYVGDKKNIGILLSGGMDSRMVAGVLNLLIEEGALTNVNIVALTWGDKRTRDVVYSKKIADTLGWNWKHFEISAEDFLKNIHETAKYGCEFSPNHLHAMLQVRDVVGLDCILAGSYGDSIGRGEYSGKTVLELMDLHEAANDTFHFLKNEAFDIGRSAIQREIDAYWTKFPQEKKYQQIEQDYQIHYMRRLLNPCMSLINEKTPVHQVFSDPRTVQFMWSLDPALRNNNVYKGLLNRFKPELREIPWARTGLIFDNTKGKPDKYLRSYESEIYSEIFKEIYEELRSWINQERIRSLSFFDWDSIDLCLKLMSSSLYRHNIGLEEKMTWLASLSVFFELYDIHLEEEESRLNYSDISKSQKIYSQFVKHFMKYYYRKYWLGKI